MHTCLLWGFVFHILNCRLWSNFWWFTKTHGITILPLKAYIYSHLVSWLAFTSILSWKHALMIPNVFFSAVLCVSDPISLCPPSPQKTPKRWTQIGLSQWVTHTQINSAALYWSRSGKMQIAWFEKKRSTHSHPKGKSFAIMHLYFVARKTLTNVLWSLSWWNISNVNLAAVTKCIVCTHWRNFFDTQYLHHCIFVSLNAVLFNPD